MTSRFKGIFDSRKESPEEQQEETASLSPAPAPEAQDMGKATGRKPRPKPAVKVVTESKPRGRPRGKRSDGEHVQVTAYIRQETHHSVKLALLADKQGQEFSELVEELLAKWLKSRT